MNPFRCKVQIPLGPHFSFLVAEPLYQQGSNPTQSIESSVQIPKREKISNEYTTVYLSPSNGINISDNNLRDLYNRANRLESRIEKVNTELQEPDRSDVLKLVEHLKDTEKSALWIIRYLTAILMLRKKLSKPFRYCSKSEIKELLEWMKAKKYKIQNPVMKNLG